ncbi:MAG: hypothetical protein GX542_01825 [Rhodococcus sp.]|nr:hypothetical protein [Rhodococcus sp. (in: high G+C Gram-positive bacteria)]
MPGTEARNTELTRLLNSDRLATYLDECQGKQDRALRLYAWNIEVASAFWGSFNVLEIALRNAIHNELSTLAGQENWWNAPIGLHQFEHDRVTAATSAARRAKGASVLPGHIVAELSFGFWTGLIANKYHQRLWVPALHAAFPHLIGPRRELHRKQETLRKLRNRIAHHEPIFARNLQADHSRLLDILGAISPEAVNWVKQNSRVPQTISRRNDVLTGTQSTTF